MTTTKATTVGVGIVGGSFQYGVIQVYDPNNVLLATYPAHFVMNVAGAPVNPATDDTLQQVVTALQTLNATMSSAIVTSSGPA